MLLEGLQLHADCTLICNSQEMQWPPRCTTWTVCMLHCSISGSEVTAIFCLVLLGAVPGRNGSDYDFFNLIRLCVIYTSNIDLALMLSLFYISINTLPYFKQNQSP